MAPLETVSDEPDAEVTLARSAAPDAISHNASVLVLTRHRYETAVKGNNGWICMVDRGWSGMLDNADLWNAKIHAAGCLNQSAARSFLPYDLKRTEFLLADRAKEEIIVATQAAIAKLPTATLPPPRSSQSFGKSAIPTSANLYWRGCAQYNPAEF